MTLGVCLMVFCAECDCRGHVQRWLPLIYLYICAGRPIYSNHTEQKCINEVFCKLTSVQDALSFASFVDNVPIPSKTCRIFFEL
jgi:hypothetical protein